MNNSWSKYEPVLTALFVALAAFGAWMLVLLGLRAGFRVFGASPAFWAMTEALSTALAAATVFGAGVIAYRELMEQASSRHIDVADRLFAELNDPQNITARRWIILDLPADPATALPPMSQTDKDTIKRVLNSLDRVAFLTQNNWIPADMVMPWMSPMILKTWDKLQPYVDYESTRRSEPDYYRQVRKLAERCRAWRRKKDLDDVYEIVEHAL